jgi:hypothetical protein
MPNTVLERGKYHLKEQLANGQIQQTIGLRPIHYQDDSGNWQEINTDWVSVGGARPNAVTSASVMVSVGDDGLRRIHPTRDLNKYVEIGAPYIKPAATWNKVALGTPTRSGNLLTWTTANANGYCWHAGHYVKLGFLLKGGWTPPNNQFAFPVGINGLTRSGSAILDNGVPVMLIDKPVVYDLDNENDRRDITFSFTSVTIGGSSQLVLLMTLPDLTGMSRPLVDPTLSLQPDATAGIDTCMNSTSSTFNYGTYNQLLIGDANVENNPYRSLIKFDLSSIPSSATITSATLSLYALTDFSSNARTLRVYRTKRAWVEGTRAAAADSPATGATWVRYDTTNNWQTAGGFGANDCEQTDVGSRAFTASETLNQFKDISLTVPTTRADMDLGNGWLLKMDTESDDRYDFASSDNATAANRPKLVVIYATQQSVSGTLTSAGTLGILQTGKVIAGTLTSAGALLKQVSKTFAGTLTSAGAVLRLTSKSFTGALSTSGDLAKGTAKTLAGALSSAGALVYVPNKAFSGTVSCSGTLTAMLQLSDPMCITLSDRTKTSLTLSDASCC